MTGLTLILLASLPVANVPLKYVGAPDYEFVGQPAARVQSGQAAMSGADGDPNAPLASYRMSGEKSLRPSRIGDDGVHMYLEWDEEQALPAVFALNALGEEEMVDGYMRVGVFTIDRVHQALVFRIGNKRAKALRVNR